MRPFETAFMCKGISYLLVHDQYSLLKCASQVLNVLIYTVMSVHTSAITVIIWSFIPECLTWETQKFSRWSCFSDGPWSVSNYSFVQNCLDNLYHVIFICFLTYCSIEFLNRLKKHVFLTNFTDF